MRSKVYLPFTFLIFLFVSCSSDIETGSVAPAIVGENVNGTPFDLTDLKGSYVMVDFWASWCGPCLREGGRIVEFNKKYSSKSYHNADGFEIVSIALEKKDGNWQKVVEKFGFDWSHQLVEIADYVRFSDYASAYGVTDIPAKFLIGPKGDLLLSKASFDTIESYLDAVEEK